MLHKGMSVLVRIMFIIEFLPLCNKYMPGMKYLSMNYNGVFNMYGIKLPTDLRLQYGVPAAHEETTSLPTFLSPLRLVEPLNNWVIF